MKEKIKFFILTANIYIRKLYNRFFNKVKLSEKGELVRDYAYALAISASKMASEKDKQRAFSKIALLANSEQALTFERCYAHDVPNKEISKEAYAAALAMKLEQFYEN